MIYACAVKAKPAKTRSQKRRNRDCKDCGVDLFSMKTVLILAKADSHPHSC